MKKTLLSLFSVILIASSLFSNVPESLLRFEGYRKNRTHVKDLKSITLTFIIKEGWHINSHSPLEDYAIPAEITIEDNPYYALESVSFPEPRITELESLGGKSSVFDGRLSVDINLRQKKADIPDDVEMRGYFSYQGCDDAVCLMPMDIEFTLNPDLKPGQAEENEWLVTQTEKTKKDDAILQKEENVSENIPFDSDRHFVPISERSLESRNFFLLLILVFAGGLALNLTPCVYPLIPVTITYFGSQKGKGNLIAMALLYVLGMAVMYSILGTAAALSGSLFGSLMTEPVVLILLALIMLALSLSMFGLYEFRLPYKLTQLGGGSRSGYIGALIMGLTMGIVAAPCIGPFVISLLTYVASSGNPLVGFILFFSMSVGLGLPYIFLAIFSAKIDNLPRSGEWLNGIRIFFGLVLVGMALWFIHPLLSAPVSEIILPLYLVIAGIYYSVFNRAGETSSGFRKVKMILSIIAVMAGTWLLKPDRGAEDMLNWQRHEAYVLQQADRENRYVMIDFYSDSCVPCKELDAITFRDPDVVDILKDFTVIKVDLTRGGSDLIERYQIQGFPTVVFLDPDGRERREYRLLGFEKPDAFVKRLKSLQN